MNQRKRKKNKTTVEAKVHPGLSLLQAPSHVYIQKVTAALLLVAWKKSVPTKTGDSLEESQVSCNLLVDIAVRFPVKEEEQERTAPTHVLLFERKNHVLMSGDFSSFPLVWLSLFSHMKALFFLASATCTWLRRFCEVMISCQVFLLPYDSSSLVDSVSVSS